MLNREICKGINNKIKGTGKRLNETTKMYNTLTNSANSFLSNTARIDEVPEYKEIKPAVKLTIVESPIVNYETNDNKDITVPYFNTPFYLECRLIADANNKHVDDVAWERVADELGVTIERAIFLVRNRIVTLNF